MSSSQTGFDVPRRQSLASQTADAIRQAIARGTWTDYLPSERHLCELLQVSRPTIRTALHSLAKDRRIEIHQGRRNRILAGPGRVPRRTRRLVGLVVPEPVSHLSFITFQTIAEMRAHLAEQGFATDILVCPPGSARVQQRKLEAFVRQNRVFCCVLVSASRQVQLWFQQHNVPALVLGSCHAGVYLPSLDIDYRSVCRHAAGILLGKEHRRLALVVPDSQVAGDLASEQGFQEAIDAHPGRTLATIVRHNGTAANITARLDALFAATHAPTALLVAKIQHVFIVMMYLLKRGLSVPDTVSLLARDHDQIFETVSPPIAHYQMSQEAYVHRLSRLMLQLVNDGHLRPEPNLVFPKYFPGGTVKAPPTERPAP